MPRENPNLLLIWTDEQRADTMGCYGNAYINTPNLNRLADESFVFENAYCVQPVCTPSRGSILSGQWPHVHGAWTNNVPIREDIPVLAELVDPGYRRAYHGKWHLGDEIIPQHGFTEWVSIEDGIYRDQYSKPEYLERRSDYHHFLRSHGFPPDMTSADGVRCFSRSFSAVMSEQYTKAGFLAQKATDFLTTHDAGQPFVLSVNFLEPHMPFFGPRNDRYDPADLPVGPTFAQLPPDDASLRNRVWARKFPDGFEQNPLQCEDDFRRLKANYYGLTSMVDSAVGRILDALDASGLADDTIVVFTSDHGEMMGDHHQITKCVLYEESVRIPWLIRVPWLSRRQTRIPGRVSQIDLLPTVLSLLGQPVPDGLAGVDRRPVLEGQVDLAENDVFVIWDGGALPTRFAEGLPGVTADQLAANKTQAWVSIISRDSWKLNLCATDPCCELYDLTGDPYEQHNRFRDNDQQPRIRDLTQRIRDWQATTGNTIPLPTI